MCLRLVIVSEDSGTLFEVEVDDLLGRVEWAVVLVGGGQHGGDEGAGAGAHDDVSSPCFVAAAGAAIWIAQVVLCSLCCC